MDFYSNTTIGIKYDCCNGAYLQKNRGMRKHAPTSPSNACRTFPGNITKRKFSRSGKLVCTETVNSLTRVTFMCTGYFLYDDDDYYFFFYYYLFKMEHVKYIRHTMPEVKQSHNTKNNQHLRLPLRQWETGLEHRKPTCIHSSSISKLKVFETSGP